MDTGRLGLPYYPVKGVPVARLRISMHIVTKAEILGVEVEKTVSKGIPKKIYFF
jgi:hypothetical protein